MFIGRKRELEFLNSHFRSKNSELVILYGRKRIGKTETLLQFAKDHEHLFFSCTECPDFKQLQNFSKCILSRNHPLNGIVSSFPTWAAAFKALADLPSEGQKKLIVIDEFPYMCRMNPAIPSILQTVWDSDLKDQNIMLILCGSAMRFIERKILLSKNPLYSQTTGICKMEQLGFYEASEFFPDYSDRDKIIAYSILGGVPFYLKQFDLDQPLSDNIQNRILEKGTPLYTESEFLIRQELREPALYNSLIGAIAAGAFRLSDIASKAGLSTAQTSVYLKNLIKLGLVKRVFSVDTGRNEKSNRCRGTYQLADPFFRFWYRYAFPNYSQLEAGQQDMIERCLIEPDLNEFASQAFKNICEEYFQLLNSNMKLSRWFSRVGHWKGKTTVRGQNQDGSMRTEKTEIDLLAISPSGDRILVGECKFKTSPFSYSEYLRVKAKLMPNQLESHFEYMLFSLSGFDEQLQEEERINPDLTLVSLEEIVHPSFLAQNQQQSDSESKKSELEKAFINQ